MLDVEEGVLYGKPVLNMNGFYFWRIILGALILVWE